MQHIEFMKKTMQGAAQALEEAAGGDLNVVVKDDDSLVTKADLASEKSILQAIARNFPEDIVYSEEAGLSSTDRAPGKHIWIIDPLDGTTNFANRYPFYCVSIARGVFTDAGKIEIEVGAVLDVPRNRLYYAEKGQGAYVDGKKLSVSRPRPFGQCFLVTGFYYAKGPDLNNDVAKFERVAQECQSIRRDGAAALDMAFVAEGIFDGFWERGLQPWDVAAGLLLVKEAGGRVLNYGSEAQDFYDLEGVGLICAQPGVAQRIFELIQ